MQGASDRVSEVVLPKPAAGMRAVTWLRTLLPFLRWSDGYSVTHLRADFVAGLTVALVLVPQSMAYARLAGLPAYYGLYAAFLPPIVAALFGSSHQLATGPVAVVSLLTAAALEPLATAGGALFVAYAVLLALLVGVFQLCLGLFRLGLIVNFLSHPVVNGFTNAAALIIATSQLGDLFGVTVEKAPHHYETVARVVVAAARHPHWPTLGLAALAFGIMIALRRLNPRIPGVLVAVVVTTLLSWATGFEHDSVAALSQIHSPEIAHDVADLNAAIAAREKASDTRVELTSALRAAVDREGQRSRQASELAHRLRVVDIDIAEADESAAAARKSLRSTFLEAAVLPDGSLAFYPSGGLPPGAESDGRRWRVRAGSTRLDERRLQIVGGGSVVGAIPAGLRFGLPTSDRQGQPVPFWPVLPTLLSTAVVISLLGFMEAISIAKAMAAKTGQRLDPSQELVGQGLANIVGSLAQAYPVSGSFSRSAVNLQAGARTGMSSVFTGLFVVAAIFFLTPLLYHLPQSVLAAIIMMAVVGLINVKGFVHSWKAQRFDGVIFLVAFACTLAFAPHLDRGILIGVALSIGLHLQRSMRPDIALLSRHPDHSFRNAARHHLELCRHIAVVRFNASLFFVNVAYLEEKILEVLATMRELKHVVIVGNAINELDASGEEILSVVVARLREAGLDVSLTGLNDSVLDVLRRTRLYERIGEDHLFRSVAQAVEALYASTHRGSSEVRCPLVHAPLVGIPSAPSAQVSKDILAGVPPRDGS